MTINEATDIIRDYFYKQCSTSAFFRFKVNNAIQDKDGKFIIWCTHACYYIEQHHRIAVDIATKEIVGIQALKSPSDLTPE